ncbi:hypothetical protein BZA05DRAFT_158012 [Tricharina praecox]|uniref:uncharacterized protein n=1 Tax=Tricharina praecox TaxID=43433 RepID=UPI00221F74C8|nr:uncharacterized protein BZA05DRAFT_158012 [Tricharina praecox]KAI5844807.1 hypothetical protein BZA05DRAFT_158012 [Tricharina praecox]
MTRRTSRFDPFFQPLFYVHDLHDRISALDTPQSKELCELAADLRCFFDEFGTRDVEFSTNPTGPSPAGPADEAPSKIGLLNDAMNVLKTAENEQGSLISQVSHDAVACLGDMYELSQHTVSAVTAVVHCNHWGREKEDTDFLQDLLQKAETNLLHITREQLGILSVSDAVSPAQRWVEPDYEDDDYSMDPFTGEFTVRSMPLTVYVKYALKVSAEVVKMLREVLGACVCDGKAPTATDVQYIAEKTGLHPHVVRDWFVARCANPTAIDTRRRLGPGFSVVFV